MFELIPYVRETFRRHLSPKQAVMLVEFDKLKRDYQEHQNEIHSKLIAIMGDRLTAHIKTLQAVDWNVPKPGGGVNDYIEILVKETVTLHKVLSRYLSIPIVEYVMTQVFAAINHGLSEEYGKIELPHQEAKNRLLADAKYLHQKLSALKNVGTPSGMLVTVISEKSIPRTAVPTSPAPPPVPVPTRASTLGATANQRLKGLLSGRSSSASVEKALPPPTRSSTLASPAQPPRPASPAPLPSHANGENGSTSTSPQHQHQPRGTSAGFKQVMEQSGSEPKPSMSLSGAVRPQNEADGSAKGADSGEVEGRSMSPPLPPPPPPVRDLDQATADFSPAHAPCSPPAPESPASLAGSELHSRSRTSMDFEKMGIWTRPDMASVDEAPVRGSDASAAPELGFSAPHAARAQQSVDSVPPPPSVPPTPPDEDGGR
ncbi:hypothetical protein H0H81_007172 [Sphagnurus paluster]|uniref:Vacuolar protein sorting-associated protein 54 C-terminal domain-containing protein n=1 Tax=Sphagnurus paluster TaxID=117069 RepID=A0A9P7KMT3_9AGAR|nr:hypothetical protein H0H81_007172 [Sphagnurus paluster]